MNGSELMQALATLPVDGNSPTGVPEPLAPHLSRMRRIARERLSLPWIEYRLLAGLGLSGWSLRYGLVQAEAAHHGQDAGSGTFKRAGSHLARVGLWQVMTVRLTTSVALVRLTALGRRLLAEIGLTPVESEWEQMERHHRGGAGQRRHTAAVCVFADHARRRGYRVTLCPGVSGAAEPDLLLERDGERSYVEVQGRGGEVWQRALKWQHAYRMQGEALICTLTPDQAQRYAGEAQRAGVARGRVTDLQTLYRTEPAGLWTHGWQSRYSGPRPIGHHQRINGALDGMAVRSRLSVHP